METNQNENLSDSSSQVKSLRTKARAKLRAHYIKRLKTANKDYATGTSHVYLEFDYVMGEHPDIADEKLWEQIWAGYQRWLTK